MTFKIVIERGEDGFFAAHFPSLRSCWSQGRTREEAISNVKEAIELYLEPIDDDTFLSDSAELVELSL